MIKKLDEKDDKKAGLYVNLHIGPFICAKWNFGWQCRGSPKQIVQMMKNEKLFESQGGPIILSLIENEYGLESKAYVAAGYAYMTWATKMVAKLDIEVPWLMYKEDDAPDPVHPRLLSSSTLCTKATRVNAMRGAKHSIAMAPLNHLV
ncbi:unnamed protein product [Ilex paraguariensis]|uniref:beta-galactosidase n=1 Tax=Ilex paraguariensis TaxID=185542 RepID=A0ABC8RGH0_9AQUA